ncbi:MAG: FAD:protein FMN transferase [Campylobacterales bacterium]|nr:FAD:protein FMN transferase [Campylobacterales bacterium]
MKTLFIFLSLTLFLLGDERVQMHMGTLIHVTVEEENLSDAVFREFATLDQTLSTYKSDSEISRLNRDFEVNASQVTREILERSLEMYRLSDGAFDVTIGSLTHQGYRFGYENEHIPTFKEVERLGKLVESSRIHIEGKRIQIDPYTIIDLGGIGKGYAVDRAIGILERRGVDKGVIAASGDIGCLGECDVSIQDPFHPDGTIAVVSSSLKRFAISTSGNYERYIKTKANNHLINPKTHQPQQRYASVTLMDVGDNTRLDALATAVSVMEEKKAIKMLEMLHIGYVLIHNDGRMVKNIRLLGVKVDFTASE